MRDEVKEALDRARDLYGIEVTGPPDKLDEIEVDENGTLSFTTEGPPRVTIYDTEVSAENYTHARRELWWHVYVGECDHVGANVTVIAGESTMHPEQLAADKLFAVPIGWGKDNSCTCIARYLRSYDHEPTEAEREWIDGEVKRLFDTNQEDV